jgi:hypothetical protein
MEEQKPQLEPKWVQVYRIALPVVLVIFVILAAIGHHYLPALAILSIMIAYLIWRSKKKTSLLAWLFWGIGITCLVIQFVLKL